MKPENMERASVPLLSISIPTYNRKHCLERLLAGLFKQASGDPRVEIIVSDNASTDGTEKVVEEFLRCGMKLRYVRNEINVGGDENIRRCFMMATGKYTWVFGDDDVVAPGALGKILALLERSDHDLVFLAPYHFHGMSDDFIPHPRLARDVFNVTSDPARLVDLVDTHSDFMFITSVIINRQRAAQVVRTELSTFVEDNIIQLSWILPVLKNLRSAMFIDAQWIGQAVLNAAGGFDASDYYGRRFKRAVNCWLDPDSPLAKKLINNHLTMWAFVWLEWRWNNENVSREKISVVNPHKNLLPVYGRNPHYWLSVYPLIFLPRVLAKLWAFPWLVRRKLLRLWYQTVTPSDRRILED